MALHCCQGGEGGHFVQRQGGRRSEVLVKSCQELVGNLGSEDIERSNLCLALTLLQSVKGGLQGVPVEAGRKAGGDNRSGSQGADPRGWKGGGKR